MDNLNHRKNQNIVKDYKNSSLVPKGQHNVTDIYIIIMHFCTFPNITY